MSVWTWARPELLQDAVKERACEGGVLVREWWMSVCTNYSCSTKLSRSRCELVSLCEQVRVSVGVRTYDRPAVWEVNRVRGTQWREDTLTWRSAWKENCTRSRAVQRNSEVVWGSVRTAPLIEDRERTMRCHWASPGFLTPLLHQTSHLKLLPTSYQPNKWTWTLREKDLNLRCLGSPPEVGPVLTFCAQWMHPDSNNGRMDHLRAPPRGRCAAALYYDWKVRFWRCKYQLWIEIRVLISASSYSLKSVCMLLMNSPLLSFRDSWSSVPECRLRGSLTSLIWVTWWEG